jgi:hypothetical protein
MIAGLASCSSSDDAPAQEGVLIKKIVETFDGGDSHTTIYGYNGNKLSYALTGDDDRKIVYTYSGNLLTRVSFQDLDGDESAYTEFEYDGSQRLIHLTAGNSWNNTPNYADYTYNDDNAISVQYQLYDNFEMEYSIENGKIFRENGDIVKSETYLPAGTRTTLHTYDNNHNPYMNITGFDKLLDYMITPHNNLSSLVTAPNGDILQQSNTTLVYGADDFPVSSVQTGIGSTKTTDYFYE